MIAGVLVRQNERLDLWVSSGTGVCRHQLASEGSISIGRGEGNTIRICDPSVSRRHAVIHMGEVPTLEDLTGDVGVFICTNNTSDDDATQRVQFLSKKSAVLGHGDRLAFGAVTVLVRRRKDEPLALPGEDRNVICDPAMTLLYSQAVRAAGSLISVLILGETGVGKELVAKALHSHSPRVKYPFMSLNCAALSETLLEAEIFGYEKGAFTGALQTRPGIFEAANGGTVFLDEVGELTLSAQAKLLRVLENRTVMRLGARKETPVDVRVVSATNRNMRAAVASGAFRQDLLFRFNSLVLTVPPLRDRASEIEPLAEHFLQATFKQIGRRGRPQLAPDAVQALQEYAWPGNVRELRNAMERAAVLSTGTLIQGFHLPPELWGEDDFQLPVHVEELTALSTIPPPIATPEAQADIRLPVRDEMRRSSSALERTRILEELANCGGNQTKAASLLGMSRRTLVTRLAQYDLPRPRKMRSV